MLRNVERIVREEMDAIGAQEVHFPALLPREPYEATGRWTEYGDNMFRLKDRKGADYLLGPTHEEMFTLLVKDLYSSYKDLPLSLYQIQTKYRDEARPRAGLLRGREFVMKDSYSFDVDDAGPASAPTPQHRDAYIRIFDRLGLDYVIVVGDVRGDGRLASEEFLHADRGRRGHLRPLHELRLRRQRRGRRHAGAARARLRRRARRARRGHPRHARPSRRWSPSPTRRSDLRRTDRDWTAADTLKNVVVKLRHPDGKPRAARRRRARRPGGRPQAARGRRRTRPRSSRSPTATSPRNPGLVKGYIGPAALGDDKPAADPLPARPAGRRRHRAGSPAPTSRAGTSFDLVAGRDFTADGTIEAAEVREGDPCPDVRRRRLDDAPAASRSATSSSSAASTPRRSDLQGARRERQAGHGHHGLATASGCPAPSPRSPRRPTTSIGLCWPREVAPADVHVVATGKDDAVFETAAGTAPTSSRRPGSGCCSTTGARCRPG